MLLFPEELADSIHASCQTKAIQYHKSHAPPSIHILPVLLNAFPPLQQSISGHERLEHLEIGLNSYLELFRVAFRIICFKME